MNILIIILVLLFGGIGSFPIWTHSARWGYGPSGEVGSGNCLPVLCKNC